MKGPTSEPIRPSIPDSGILRAVDEQRFAFSHFTLEFFKPEVEARYLSYRTPVILRNLRLLLLIAALLVLLGSIVDFTRLDRESAYLITMMRIGASLGMVAAWKLTFYPAIQRNLQMFIAVGAGLMHLTWLLTAVIVGERITEYVGMLPINIMMTFLVSGLLVRKAVWVALAAAVAYILVLIWLHPAPAAPILYVAISGLLAGIAGFVSERARREAWSESRRFDLEREKSEHLLLNVLPPSIATRMKQGEGLIADRFEDAAVLFADIAGFTKMSASMDPAEVVSILDTLFRRIDDISDDYDLEKIKTIGDCYMLACGLPSGRQAADAARIADAALRIRSDIELIAANLERPISVRIGIHCGPVIAGVIGRSKFTYDLWGDTVNVAARFETAAPDGGILISDAMRQRLEGSFELTDWGRHEMKGKGLQQTWLLVDRL